MGFTSRWRDTTPFPPWPLADHLARTVRERFPYGRCFSCLAAQLAVREPELRNAAQMLVFQGAFRPVRRVCNGCSRARETLALEPQRAG